MKYFIISIILFISSGIYAQIGKSKKLDKQTVVGEVKRIVGNYYSYYILAFKEDEGGKRTYSLAFTEEHNLYDMTSADTRVLIFIATQNELDYLFNFLVEGFKENQSRYLEVGQDIVKTVPPIRKFLYIYVDFKDGTSASLKLKKRQLFKLFGKK